MTILTTTSGSSDHNSNTASHGSKDTGDDTGTPAIDTGYVRADDDDSVLRAARNAVSDTEHGYGPPYHGAGTHQQQRQQVDQYNCSGAGNYGPRPYVLGSLHRDYLRDLEDGVVLALPWPTQKDLEDVQALLSKRTAAKKFYQRLAFRSALACVLLIGVWLFIVVADGRREDDGGGNEDENTRLDEVTRKIFGFLALILTLWWCIWVMHTHFDEKVQTKVRKLIDSTEGLEYNDHELDRQAPNRHDANQAAAFKLPEYVNGGAVSDNNNISFVSVVAADCRCCCCCC